MSDPLLEKVHGFWNTEACDTNVVENAADDRDFYERFREQRYRTQWHIPLLVPFAKATGMRGNRDRRLWEAHYHNFLKEGWAYLRASHFVHHCTDGPECPVARAFSKRQARTLFAKFGSVEMKVAHFPLKRHHRWIPFGLEKFLAARVGWYLFIFAGKL